MPERQYPWWSPSEWYQQSAPADYHAFLADPAIEWITGLAEHHFHLMFRSTNDEGWASLSFDVFGNPDRYSPTLLMVVMSVNEAHVQTFFVDQHSIAQFWVEKFPGLVAKVKQIAADEWRVRQGRAMVAFVRHGHSPETIDEMGEKTFDDRDQELVASQLRNLRRPGKE